MSTEVAKPVNKKAEEKVPTVTLSLPKDVYDTLTKLAEEDDRTINVYLVRNIKRMAAAFQFDGQGKPEH